MEVLRYPGNGKADAPFSVVAHLTFLFVLLVFSKLTVSVYGDERLHHLVST
jgi:hypothetical protein